MKKYLFFFTLLTSSTLFAQQNTAFKKGQEIKVTVTTDQNIDMGMAITSKSTSVNKISIIDVTAKDYLTVTQKVKLQMENNMFGQATTFDSDKPEDRNSDIGKEMGKALSKVDSFYLDVKTGDARPVNPENKSAEEGNPMAMMGNTGNESDESTVSSLLFILPFEASVGKKWVDSSTENGMKKIITYSIEKMENNTVYIKMDGAISGNSSVEMQGQQLDMSISSKTTGEIIMDKITSVVKKRNSTSEISGTIDAGGQSMPFTSKTIVTSIYE